ncbi:7 transmembrane receptor [Necator americanus]|uniref:7 transmembrane receptor n=1 Tax=Necator americanus TaxID=51031 RepID=W2SYA3_NECAM|nr:7 transmembrane receptor [Necator americanus]ETN74744.1 7 transmembrane receptor [Necator americanus]
MTVKRTYLFPCNLKPLFESLITQTMDNEEDALCYMVEEKAFEYEYDEEFDWENMTSAQCNCSHPLHKFLEVCVGGCAIVPDTLLFGLTEEELFEAALPALLYLTVFLDFDIYWEIQKFQFVKYMSHTWFMGRFACYSVHYIQQFTCFCSVLTMTMISFERYLAIAYPMRTMWLSSIGRAKKVILLIWLLSAILAIPTAVRIDYETNISLSGHRIHWCRRRFPNGFLGYSRIKLNRVYAVYQMLLLIVFPVVTMSICYARVAVIVYTSSKGRLALSQAMVAFSKAATDAVHFSGYSTIPMISSSRQLKTATSTINAYNKHKSARVAEANKKQIVQMLISIVVMYTVCWMPTIIDELLTSFGYICRTSNTPFLKYMRMGFNALTYCQSCINPILYAFISQNFRATFKSAYARMKHRFQGMEEMRSRMGSCSSASMLSTRNQHRIYGSSFNTLTVPGRSVITPNMSRDASQLSLCRPGSTLSFALRTTPITPDATSTFVTRPRNVGAVCSALVAIGEASHSDRERSIYAKIAVNFADTLCKRRWGKL